MNTATSTSRPPRPTRRRHWPLWLAAILLSLTPLLWAGYQYRITLLTGAANTWLQTYDLQITRLDDVTADIASAQIGQLALLHSASGAMQTLREINIGFSVSALLRGRVGTITIASADFRLPALPIRAADSTDTVIAPRPDAAGNSPATDIGAQMTNMLATIPFQQLRIDKLTLTLDTFSTGPVRAEGLSAGLAMLRMTCRPGQCHISTDLDLSLNKLHYTAGERDIELDLITFNTDVPLDITVESATNAVVLTSQASTLTLPAIRVDDSLTGLVASIRRLNLSQTLSAQGLEPVDLYAHAEVSVRELYTNLVDFNLWSMQLDQHLTWERNTLHAMGALVQHDQRLLVNDLHHDIALGTGQGTLEVPSVKFNDSTARLSDLLSPLPWSADVVGGSISAHARLNWQYADHTPVVTGPVQVTMDSLSGYVNEVAFLGLSSDFAADLMPAWHLRSTRSALVSLASLDAGIELGNIRSNVRVDSTTGSIVLTDISLNVFGGTVSSEGLDYQFQDNDSLVTIVLERIDLNQVLGMSAYQAVSATGLVSGHLPVRLRGLTPSIKGGTLSALPPGGTIRYESHGSMAGNQSLDMVYQALEHYRFNLMETQVDYQESGELDLAIRMEGISPELNGGQRINLNLNINDDIPALLQSLQAARSVTDTIQARLDARQN